MFSGPQWRDRVLPGQSFPLKVHGWRYRVAGKCLYVRLFRKAKKVKIHSQDDSWKERIGFEGEILQIKVVSSWGSGTGSTPHENLPHDIVPHDIVPYDIVPHYILPHEIVPYDIVGQRWRGSCLRLPHSSPSARTRRQESKTSSLLYVHQAVVSISPNLALQSQIKTPKISWYPKWCCPQVFWRNELCGFAKPEGGRSSCEKLRKVLIEIIFVQFSKERKRINWDLAFWIFVFSVICDLIKMMILNESSSLVK